MEQKKSTVATATYKRSYQSKFGEMFVHEITFENGDKGDYNAKGKDQDKFVPGKEVEYTIETKINGNFTNVIIKPVSDKPAVGGGFKAGTRSGNESFALSYAKDLGVAQIAAGKLVKSTEVIEVAEVFFNWLESKKK